MTMLKKSIYTLLPSLAFLTFRGKGGGGGNSISTQKLDPEVLQKMLLPMYSATERAAGVTPITDADGNVTYAFDDYEGYGGNQLTDWRDNPYYSSALLNPENITNMGKFGEKEYGNASQRYGDLMNYGGPDNIATHFAGAPDSLQATGVTGANVTKDAFGIMTPQVRGNVRDVNAGTFPGADISQYTNPYQSEVIDTTLDALDRQRQIQQQQNAAGATQAGAFGGSRHGVVEAETNRAYADQAARTAALLNSQGFDTAAGLQQADADRAMSAGLANQGVDQAITSQALDLAGQFGLANQSADLQAGAINYGGELDTSLANANAVNTAAIHDADLDLASKELNLGAGGQLMDLVAQGRDAHQSNLETLMSAGDFVDDRGQMGLDLNYQKWLDEQNYPAQQAGMLQSGFGMVPQLTSTKTQGPGKPDLWQNLADTFSDVRLKDNITKLNGYSYNFKSRPEVTTGGVMAQEVELIAPHLVNTDVETGYKRVNYEALVGVLLEAVKDLKSEVEGLKRG